MSSRYSSDNHGNWRDGSRLAARIKSFNERGIGKVEGGMHKPGSQNRKK